MRYYFLFLFFLLIFLTVGFSQNEPGFSLSIQVSDNMAPPQILKFGLDPSATDGIDTVFGESDLPPDPPPGAFVAKMILPKDNFNGSLSSWIDIRAGSFPFTGQKEHRLKYQPGAGSVIMISWNFPPNVTGRLQDAVLGTLIDVNMTGQSSFEVLNPTGFDRLKMLINYNNVVSGIADEFYNPNEFTLYQNFPNPFNPSTKIRFSLITEDFVSLKVYNQLGEVVEVLTNEVKQSGNYEYDFNPKNLSSGIYFYQLTTNNFTKTRKMILQK